MSNSPTPLETRAVHLHPMTFADYDAAWRKARAVLRGGGPFVTPAWLQSWWACFGDALEPLLLCGVRGEETVGLVPLAHADGIARFMGSADICDHWDLIVAPDAAEAVAAGLLDALTRRGMKRLALDSVRPDSHVAQALLPVAEARGLTVTRRANGVSLETVLEPSWDAWLGTLKGKYRHEIRRKLRRAEGRGDLAMRTVTEPAEVDATLDDFMALFRSSRPDKQAFMTPVRETYFRTLGRALAEAGALRLMKTTLDGHTAAIAFCIEHDGTMYLYNNGYDIGLRDISIGQVNKIMAIRASVEAGCRVFDFLNGSETYKSRLGGHEVSLAACEIVLQP